MSKHAALDTFGRSGNPVIRSSAFNQTSSSTEVMTLDGAVNKIGIMLALLVFTASISWIFNGNPIISILQTFGTAITGIVRGCLSLFWSTSFSILNPRTL